jgi:hypothetical protein
MITTTFDNFDIDEYLQDKLGYCPAQEIDISNDTPLRRQVRLFLEASQEYLIEFRSGEPLISNLHLDSIS